MSTFRIKAGDTAPALRFQLLDDTTPVNLTLATTVRILIADTTGDLLVDDVATPDTGQGTPPAPGATTGRGWCTYPWAEALTAIGAHRTEAEVTWSDGTVQTFPPADYAHIVVTADLG